jgi:outer membrane usher protein FimD/PapC
MPAKAQRPMVVDLPLMIDDRAVGDLTVILRESVLAGVDPGSWRTVTAGLLEPKAIEALAAAAQDGVIPVEAFARADLPLRYDAIRLLVILEPRREQRTVESLSMGARSRAPVAVHASESNLSAFVNARAIHDYLEQPGGSATEEVRLALDGAVRAFGPRGIVLESAALYNGLDDRQWQRGNTRLVHDDVERAIRYSAGDVRFQSAPLQGNVPLLGLSAERRFTDLQPLRAISATTLQSFVLPRPSRVTVILNGIPLRTFQLVPGRYSLSDLSAADGANEVRLEIEDSAGQREVIEFTLFREVTLLPPGISEFSANVGLRRLSDLSNSIRYDKDRPTWSGYFRYGLTDTLTAGASYQGDAKLNAGTVEGVVATSAGNFSGVLGFSDHDVHGVGRTGQARWSYNFSESALRRVQRLDLSALYTSAAYVPLGIDVPDNRYSWQYQARLPLPLPPSSDTLASLSAGHARSRIGSIRDDSRLTLLLTRRFGSVSATLGLERVIGGLDIKRGYLTLSIPLDSRQRILASAETQDRRGRLEWFKARAEEVGDVSGSLGVENSRRGQSVVADAVYTGNRFVGSLQRDLVQSRTDRGTESSQRMRILAESAVGYAGGHVAIGRPVRDAFAIVSRHRSLGAAELDINPSASGPIARADSLGSALVPMLNSYRPAEVTWEANDLPDYYDMGDTRRIVQPSYRAGIHMQVGSAASLIAGGLALQPDGSPLALVAGEVSVRDGTEAPVGFFTNRQGRFVLQALAPGTYRLVFKGVRPYRTEITITEGAGGFIDLGVIRLQEDK